MADEKTEKQEVSGITQHAAWLWLREWFKIEVYARDGGHRNPRFRIEVRPPYGTPDLQVQVALQLDVPCVSCAQPINPIRVRSGPSKRQQNGPPKHLFYAATCPLDVRIGCSRSKAASAEYIRVAHAVDPAMLDP